MPSFGIHILVADAAFSRLGQSSDPEMRSLSAAVRSFPAMATLGSIGPDLFYFLGDGPLIAGAVADVFTFLDQLSGLLDPVGRLAQQSGMPNVADRVSQLGELATLAVGTGQSGLLAAVVQLNEIITGSHLFNPSAAQQEKPESDWNWGDILHDRISGVFATQLMQNARKDSNFPLMAYASGYVTHLAADFVGHAYVNTVVGGPARGWLMRHTVAEKFMDASVYDRRNVDINTAALHKRFSSLSGSDQLKGLLGSLAQLVGAFASDQSLGFLTPRTMQLSDLEEAFSAMCSLFALVTEYSYVPPPVGPGITIPPIPGQYGTLTHTVAGIPPPGRPRSITDWLRFLLALLLLAPAVITDMVKFIIDAATGIITYPLAAAVYVFQTFLYNLYRQVRWFLVISGIVFPCLDELKSPLALQFVPSRGNTDDNYPHQPPIVSKWTERLGAITFSANNYDYLNYPATRPERPRARPSPYPAGSLPELFMFDLQRDDSFVASWLAKITPAEVRKLVDVIQPVGTPARCGFGNATDLSILLLSRPDIAAKLNLDSDRGYGYRQWRCNNGGIASGNLVSEWFA